MALIECGECGVMFRRPGSRGRIPTRCQSCAAKAAREIKRANYLARKARARERQRALVAEHGWGAWLPATMLPKEPRRFVCVDCGVSGIAGGSRGPLPARCPACTATYRGRKGAVGA